MADELIPPTPPENNPLQPVPVTPEEAVEPKPKRNPKGVLESLPLDVKSDMERFLLTASPNSCKKYMANSYADRFQSLITVSKESYALYKKRHIERMQKEVTLQKQLSAPPPEMMTVIDSFSSTSISINDKRKALTDLFNVCNARKELLVMKNQVFIDPFVEKLILENVNAMVKIIEKVTVLNKQLSDSEDKDYGTELKAFFQTIMANVANVYKLVNGENNYSHFQSLLNTHLENALKSYKMQ